MTANRSNVFAAPFPARLLLLACTVALSACSTGSTAVVDTLAVVVSPNAAIKHAVLQPDVRYLRVEVGHRVALFVLGYLDQDDKGATVEVWYGAGAEMLRLINGRIVTAKGFTEEVIAVSEPGAAAWTLTPSVAPVSYARSRDLMPRYRYAVADVATDTALASPPSSSIEGLDPSSLKWFAETSDHDSHPDLYAVRFNGNVPTVLYSEQCPTPTLCFILQEWPPGGNLHAN